MVLPGRNTCDTQPQLIILATDKTLIDLTFCMGVKKNGCQDDQAANKCRLIRAMRKNKAQIRGWKDEVISVQGENAILRQHNKEKLL